VNQFVCRRFRGSLAWAFVLLSIPGLAQNAVRSLQPDESAIRRLDEQDAATAMGDDVNSLAESWTEDGVLVQPFSKPVTGKVALRELFEQQKNQSAQVKTLAYEEDWKERRVQILAASDSRRFRKVSPCPSHICP
jgi:hypothetical protein